MNKAERVLAFCMGGVIVSLLAVGLAGATPVRHLIQVAPAAVTAWSLASDPEGGDGDGGQKPEAATLSENWIREMGERALILEAHHTTHIEGTQLTLEQAERLLVGETVPEADPDDVRELLNYRRAFDLVSEFLGSGARASEGLVREIHKRLVQGVRGGRAAPGEYRKVQNCVINSVTGEKIYTLPAACDVPVLMAEMVAWINEPGQVHPVLASGVAQFQLVHIHPFLDGNGRTSRRSPETRRAGHPA